MSYRDLLVALKDTPQCASTMQVAATLARRFDAHLTGLFVNTPPRIPTYVEVHIPPEVLRRQREEREEGTHGDLPGADIALHLARHGVTVEAQHTIADDVSIGDMLLNRVADASVDLIVMGAYGHSRVREMVLGGVTRRAPALMHEGLTLSLSKGGARRTD